MLRVTTVWLMNLRPYSPTWKAVTDWKSSEEMLLFSQLIYRRFGLLRDAEKHAARDACVAHGHALGE